MKKEPPARVLSSRVVFRGKVFYVTSDQVVEPGGIQARRDVVRHQGSVVIIALDDSRGQPRVLLVRQYRHAVGDYLWELPAGRIDAGESELAAARRELREETGYSASEWRPALYFYSSPGFLQESMALYLARELRRGQAQPEEDEVIRLRFFPLTQALRMVMTGKLRDGKSVAGILWLGQRLRGNPRQ